MNTMLDLLIDYLNNRESNIYTAKQKAIDGSKLKKEEELEIYKSGIEKGLEIGRNDFTQFLLLYKLAEDEEKLKQE